MDFRFTPEEDKFRQEIRDWLKENLPNSGSGDRFSRTSDDNDANPSIYLDFAKKLASKGWVAPHWPEEYGGLGLSVIQQLIFNEEMAYASAPIGYSMIGVGWAGPTIIVYGTDEQKKDHLSRITNAETMWCQGFSEPNAGSDLAALQTRAVRDGDDYVINGQKIWTSGAHFANWMILIARTDQDAPKHKGISYFLLDMTTPGIRTSPLIDMMGNHAFNEVFFEDVRIPRSALLGEENRGWYMATTTLDFERSSIGGAVGGQKLLEDLKRFVDETSFNGRLIKEAPGVQGRLADCAIDVELGRILSYRVATLQARGQVPNYESSIAKLFNTDMQFHLGEAGMEIMGLYGQLETDSKWVHLQGRFQRQWMWQTGLKVGGGTTEIQKNIIAQRGLGMPRG